MRPFSVQDYPEMEPTNLGTEARLVVPELQHFPLT